ncbi:MAG: HlyD family efflux transporter periplasmic adaptor subunit, partial [Magnetococcales bacterium]|nr:HlyD family efflux transporter periplasmic adaptor subunit [Magnetococcales bacterium]
IAEGDLKKMLGAPVQTGDVLFKVARLDQLYADLAVDERDIHEINTNQTGEIAFVGRPDHRFAISVARIRPMAEASDQGNQFHVRATIADDPAPWWRPGMSGVAKISAGDRVILWILTHRTVDFLRMALWW